MVMARYVVTVRSPQSPNEAFAYMADLRNFAEWDPGVVAVEQVEGDGAGPDSVFDVTVDGVRDPMTLRYETTLYDAPTTIVARAESSTLTSLDTITVEPDGDGSLVTYDAELTLGGALRFADPILGVAFKRIGDKAAAGLVEALDGEEVGDARPDGLSSIADAVLEAPILTSFTRIGYEARRRLEDWTPLDEYDMTGRVVVVTGATSGLGRAAATQLARCGATLVLVGRIAERNQRVVDEMVAETGNDAISQVAADMGDYDQVRALAKRILADHDRLDVLIHNAGALTNDRRDAPDGTEATVASQVVGPFLLTSLLLDRLAESAPSRVLTMSSGGMYSTGLTVDELQMSAAEYKGTEQYARAKRAQVTLNEMWADRYGDRGIRFHSLHPGWADTPGVDDALPGFAKVMGPLLRTPEQGADTLVWLAADDAVLESNGEFWLDRVPRSIHKLKSTRETDQPFRREALWDWVVETAGIDPGRS